jgi:hypothetical protein
VSEASWFNFNQKYFAERIGTSTFAAVIQSAIFLFSATTLINTTRVGRVLPVINTNHTATIAVALQDGQTILGQCEISHPARPRPLAGLASHSGLNTPASAVFDPFQAASILSKVTVGSFDDGLEPDSDMEEEGGRTAADGDDDDEEDELITRGGEEDLTLPKPRNRSGNIVFTKGSGQGGLEERLPSPIDRLFYVNAYGNEIRPAPNPEYINSIHKCKTLLYSCGSLWTSIVPCLALRGVGSAIVTSHSLRYKILLLNTLSDRETYGLTGLDFVRIIARAMSHNDDMEITDLGSVITHIVYSPAGDIPLDVEEVERLGIRCVAVSLPRGHRYLGEEQVKLALDEITKR